MQDDMVPSSLEETVRILTQLGTVESALDLLKESLHTQAPELQCIDTIHLMVEALMYIEQSWIERRWERGGSVPPWAVVVDQAAITRATLN